MFGRFKKKKVFMLYRNENEKDKLFVFSFNLVFKRLELKQSEERSEKKRFKGKQDLLVHLRAREVLGSYCPRLDNPGM